jgi:cytochrome P450
VLGRSERVTMAARMSMPYTSATVNEIQRCANIVPMNVLHATKSSVNIGGYMIPKGGWMVGCVDCFVRYYGGWTDLFCA